MDDRLTRVLQLSDFEGLAEATLERSSFDYIAGGAGEEITLRDNIAAFQRRRLCPRVLVDVSKIDLSTEMLGGRVALPVGVAPMAFQHLAHPDAELAMARASVAAGAAFCLSTLSSFSIEEVAEAGDGTDAPHGFGRPPRWFQLYVHRDRGVSAELVARAEAAGYSAITVTVDLPVAGYRMRDLRNDLAYPQRFGNFPSTGSERPLIETIAGMNDRSLAWRDVAWLRGLTKLPIVIKGVVTADDAARAVAHGAAGVWVSNHGGRQLDRSLATIDVLDEVVQAVAGRAEVYLDSGVRRGVDVVTALAMGARAVFIGKAFDFALAVGGEAGVRRAFALLTAEVESTMALMGVTSVSRLTRRMVVP